ncbi:MAG: thioredoxin [Candidatus Muiribacteriota bacterium]
MMAKIINEQDFNDLISKKADMLVDFYADWCGPCKMIAPIIEELATEYEGKVEIVKVNVDSTPSLAQKFGVTGIPTILFFKNGELAKTHVGFADKDSLKKIID